MLELLHRSATEATLAPTHRVSGAAPATFSTVLTSHHQMLPRPVSAAALRTQSGIGGASTAVGYTHSQRKPQGYRTFPRSPSVQQLASSESAMDEMGGVQTLPRIARRTGVDAGSYQINGSEIFRGLAAGYRKGDHAWGAVKVVRPGDAEDDDTPR